MSPVTMLMRSMTSGMHASIEPSLSDKPFVDPSRRKIVSLERIAAAVSPLRERGGRVVLCHGCFDLLHPGHVAYLQAARGRGEALVVSITSDDGIEKHDALRPEVPQEHRSLALAALACVNFVVVVDHATAEPILRELRPDVYVKGKEYQSSGDPRFLAEAELVRRQGGSVAFDSGSVVYSSTQLLASHPGAKMGPAERVGVLAERWGLDVGSVQAKLAAVRGKRVAVVGDTLLDRYTHGQAAGLAADAPAIHFKPQQEDDHPGGAAIIALHLRALGAQPVLMTSLGRDLASLNLRDSLESAGVDVRCVEREAGLPIKQRFLLDGRSVFKVDHAISEPLNSTHRARLAEMLTEASGSLDAVVFTDFGLGVTSPPLLEAVLPTLRRRGVMLAGDVSGCRGTLPHMRNFDLLTPTESELRGDLAASPDEPLPTLALRLMRQLETPNLLVTLGAKGLLAFHPRVAEREQWFAHRLRADHVPSLLPHAVDPTGAGDALLSMAVGARLAGLPITTAALLGTAAAAHTASRVGNQPLELSAVLQTLAALPMSPATMADAA